MSQISLARASRRRVLLAAIAAAAATAGLSAAAQDAQAAFTLGPCAGASGVVGQGASFQRGAQGYFSTVFNGSNGCGGSPTAPTYKANGSGNGLAAMGAGGGNKDINGGVFPLAAGVRDLTTSFAATDDPPSTTQQAAMNTGGSSASDDGAVHIIPVATGSSPVIVHAPEGCDLSTIENKTNLAEGTVGGANTGNESGDKTQRLRIPNDRLELAFAGDSGADTWGEIAKGISGIGKPTGQNAGRPCADIPVKRIVRQDASGTTFSFKAYLSLINPGRGWNELDNRTWPNGGTPTATGGTGQPAFCPDTLPRLCSGTASGNGSLADAVNATDGSIGYNDLATARGKGFTIIPSLTTQDYTFWLPLQNNPGGPATGYSEPTLDPAGNKSTATTRGANCQNVAVRDVPTPAGSPGGDPTLGDWSKAFAAGGPVYGACVLTYALAWDDNAPVYGNTANEEAKARTVKDFLATAVGGFGQQFAGVDYSPLPNPQTQPLQTYAQNAVNAIGWNKTASSGGTPPPVLGPGPAPAPAPAPGPAPAPIVPRPVTPVTVTRPSNRFSVSAGKLNRARTVITYTVKLPRKGTLSTVSSYVRRGKTVTVSRFRQTVSGARTLKVTVRLSKRARSDLRRLKRLRIASRFTYKPLGGTAASQRKAVNVRVRR